MEHSAQNNAIQYNSLAINATLIKLLMSVTLSRGDVESPLYSHVVYRRLMMDIDPFSPGKSNEP